MKSQANRGKGRPAPTRRTVLQVEQMEDRSVPSILIPVPNHRDLVYDPVRNLLDITTSSGTIQQYNVKTQTLMGALNFGLGGSLNGADLSPDGSTLYFAQQTTPGATGQLFAFNFNTGALNPVPYGPVSGEGGPWDIALASNGKGLFDGISNGAAVVPVRQVALGSNAVAIRQDAPGSGGGGRVRPNTLVHRSADRSLLLFTEAGNTSGPVFTYNANTNTFGPRINLGIDLTNTMAAVNRNGTLLAFDMGSQVMVMDANYNVRNQLGGLDGGVAFDPNQDVLYAVWPSGDQIVAFDTNTWAVKYQLPIGKQVALGQAFGNGVMTGSSDSNWLFLSTPSGVRAISLPTSPGPAVSLGVAGFPQATTTGTFSPFTVTALDASGRTATGYRGTVHFTSSDPRASLPIDYTFTAADNGVHTFTTAFKTAGTNQYLAATDTVTGSITGGEGGIMVSAGPVASFVVHAPTNAQPAGYAIPLTVYAEDATGNVVGNYAGTVHFTSSDAAATLPADYTFVAADRGVLLSGSSKAPRSRETTRRAFPRS